GPGGGCGVPSQAGAVVAVVKAVQPAGAGNFKFADGNTDPTTVSGSQLSFQKLSPAVNLGTEVLIPVHTDGTANVRVQLSATHVSITIIGYVQDAKDLFHTRAQALDLFAQRSNVVPVHYVATDNATDIAAGNPTTGTVVSVNFDIVDECSGLFSRDEHKLLVTATFMTDEGGGDLDLDAYVRINGVDAAPTGDNLEVITALESNNQHYVIKVLIDNPDANNDGDHTDNTDVVGSGNHTVALVIDNYDDDAVSLDEASITVEHVGWNCGSSIIIFP
ncbi:MAG: hypothetical protein R3249_08740, partial [Nitriliruptorales bacterium]|nr:hypothetical protein [Nitriliruptorales bacterium]